MKFSTFKRSWKAAFSGELVEVIDDLVATKNSLAEIQGHNEVLFGEVRWLEGELDVVNQRCEQLALDCAEMELELGWERDRRVNAEMRAFDAEIERELRKARGDE